MTIVCGHRGTPAHRPENTIEGFRFAAELGATWVEFDVRPAAGQELVVHHDPVDSTGRLIVENTATALGVPTLDDVVASCSDLGLDIELKTDDTGLDAAAYAELVAPVVASIAASHPTEVIVTSFDADVLERLRPLAPEVATGLLFHDRSGEWAVGEAVRAGHRAIAPWHPLVDRRLVDQAHEAGLDVMTWTVNSAAAATRVLKAGVDMVIGDDPSLLVDLVDRA